MQAFHAPQVFRNIISYTIINDSIRNDVMLGSLSHATQRDNLLPDLLLRHINTTGNNLVIEHWIASFCEGFEKPRTLKWCHDPRHTPRSN